MDIYVCLQLITILLLLFLISRSREGMCVKRDYGFVTDVPASIYADANTALVKSHSLGQAPLGDPQFWIPDGSPITQGQYGLYRPIPPSLAETQPFDRSTLIPAAEAIPVYTQK